MIAADTEMITRFVQQGSEWLEKLEEVRCPVLLTASKKDDMLPEVVSEMCSTAGRIERCRVFINDKGNHPLMWSQPEIFQMVTEVFLRTM